MKRVQKAIRSTGRLLAGGIEELSDVAAHPVQAAKEYREVARRIAKNKGHRREAAEGIAAYTGIMAAPIATGAGIYHLGKRKGRKEKTAYDLGVEAGLEKTAATRALKELRKMAPKAFPKGHAAHAGRWRGDTSGNLKRIAQRMIPYLDKQKNSDKLIALANSHYSRRGLPRFVRKSEDALTSAAYARPRRIIEMRRSGNQSTAKALIDEREGAMREALKNPDFSYNRNTDDAAARVRARAERMGLGK